MFLANGSVRFNCTIIDLYDRSVVASDNGKNITSELTIRTLSKAIQASKCDYSQLILHSDQGSQFTSLEFTNNCSSPSITQSMSRAGCPYDNAPMERYYNTLKAELVNQYNFQIDEELSRAIQEFAYLWCNQIRPHSYNQYMTPFESGVTKRVDHYNSLPPFVLRDSALPTSYQKATFLQETQMHQFFELELENLADTV